MRNAVPSQMEYCQGFAFWFILDDVIERLDQTAHTFFAADAFIEQFLVDHYTLPRAALLRSRY